MRVNFFASSLVVAGLLFSACTVQPDAGVANHVKELIEQYKFSIVDYDYAKQAIGNGTRD